MLGVLGASGLLAAAAGSLHSYSLSSAQPDLGFNPLIFATIAARGGGVKLAGGHGSPIGIAAGVLSLAILEEILAATAAPQYTGDLVTGLILTIVTIAAAPAVSNWWGRNKSATYPRRASGTRSP
jgi:ribose/xylose/arabinose/galactoside ABC-type transport system permease subunit